MKKSGQVHLAFFLVVVSYLFYGCPNVPPYGSLTVIITPHDAISAGAQWRVDQGMWKKSNGTVHGLALGEHTVSFSSVGGWIAPQDQIVTIHLINLLSQ